MVRKYTPLKMNKRYSDDEAFIEKWNSASASNRHIIVIDEFGNTGPSRYRETKFGYGVSDVNDVKSYVKISRESRKAHKNDEQKAKSSSLWERFEIALKIRDTKTKTSCVYVDKNTDTPDYMASHRRSNRIYGVLNDTLEETLPRYGVVWVVIDNNTQYINDSKLKKVCKSYSDKRRTVYGNQYSSKGTSLPSDLLQTNDFVANAARSNVELGQPLRSRILKMRFVQLGKNHKQESRAKGRMVKKWNPGSR